MNTRNQQINVLHTIHAPEKGRKAKPYIAAAIAMFIMGGLYFADLYEFGKSTMLSINQVSERNILVITKAEPEPRERTIQANSAVELKDKIKAMQTRQKQRSVQINAYLQSASAPQHIPDLPTIKPLEAPQKMPNQQLIRDQLEVNTGHTLPRTVMDKFTAETGLTRAEIEQAMNQ